MKKLGLVAMFFGIILVSGIGFIFYTEGAEAFSIKTVKIHKEEKVNSTAVQRIMVDSGSVDVEVLPSTSSKNEISVELNGEVSQKMKDAYKMDVLEHNGTLDIQIDRTMRPSFVVFAINKGMHVTVNVPERLYEEIHLEAASGDIMIKDLSVNELSLTSTSGDISGEGLLDYSHLSLTTTSGDVTLDTPEKAFTLDFKAGSGEGRINVPDFTYKEKAKDRIIGSLGKGTEHTITVRTNSGDLTLGR